MGTTRPTRRGSVGLQDPACPAAARAPARSLARSPTRSDTSTPFPPAPSPSPAPSPPPPPPQAPSPPPTHGARRLGQLRRRPRSTPTAGPSTPRRGDRGGGPPHLQTQRATRAPNQPRFPSPARPWEPREAQQAAAPRKRSDRCSDRRRGERGRQAALGPPHPGSPHLAPLGFFLPPTPGGAPQPRVLFWGCTVRPAASQPECPHRQLARQPREGETRRERGWAQRGLPQGARPALPGPVLPCPALLCPAPRFAPPSQAWRLTSGAGAGPGPGLGRDLRAPQLPPPPPPPSAARRRGPGLPCSFLSPWLALPAASRPLGRVPERRGPV